MRFCKKLMVHLSAEKALTPLSDPFRSALLSMYKNEPQCGTDGVLHTMDAETRIYPEQGMYLYNLCRSLQPKRTLEIGLAYGFSAVYILAAQHDNGKGSHTAIEPFAARWHGIGQAKIEQVGMNQSFTFVAERSFPALAELGRKSEWFDLIFIDGNHKFDDVLVDFTLSAEICPIGGYIVFDDILMPSIGKVLSFIQKNRKDFERMPIPVFTMAAFRRIAADSRAWNYHVKF